ncbi:hypothetical protein [Bacteroides sp.]
MNTSIYKITTSKGKSATGFLIAKNTILTAYHTFLFLGKDEQIYVWQGEELLTACIIDKDRTLDVVLLKVDIVSGSVCEMQSRELRLMEYWQTEGFPSKADSNGMVIKGQVGATKIDSESCDYQLDIIPYTAGFRYQGLSGAPVFMGSVVTAVVLQDDEGKLFVASIKKLAYFLRVHNIVVSESKNDTDIPDSLVNESRTTIPNQTVCDGIDELLKEPGSWYLLCGNPGSGKTIISSTYEPISKDILVLGRYFFKVPSDDKTLTVRCSKSFWVDWLEEVVYRNMNENLPAISSMQEKLKNVTNWFTDLETFLAQDSKTGVLIIDGIDELLNGYGITVAEFFAVLPKTLPLNIKILLSCTSRDILSPDIKQLITPNVILHVTPLTQEQCEQYIYQETKASGMSVENRQLLAVKSEGHPLYLNYLVSYFLQESKIGFDQDNFAQWIEMIPAIGGNIELYYEHIWDNLSKRVEALSLLQVLSQLRGCIDEKDLADMQEPEYLTTFMRDLKSIGYLLKITYEKQYEIYHSSFQKYVENQMPDKLRYMINDRIVTFCKASKDNRYAIANGLYHMMHSSQRTDSLPLCDQCWADRCVKFNIEPEQVIADIRECLKIAFEEHDIEYITRIMLLAQRIEFRYDSVFVYNAYLLAELMILTGFPNAAYRYLVRENSLQVDVMDCIKLLQMMYEKGYNETADRLTGVLKAQCRRNLYSKDNKYIDGKNIIVELHATTLSQFENYKTSVKEFAYLMSYYNEIKYKMIDAGHKEIADVLEETRKEGVAYNNAWLIRQGFYISLEKMSEHSQRPLEKLCLTLLANALIKYRELNTPFSYMGKNEQYYEAVQDLCYQIKKNHFTYEENEARMLVLALIEDCKESGVVESLLSQCNIPNLVEGIRKTNGVDLEFKSISYISMQYWFKGYLVKSISDAGIICRFAQKTAQWESYLICLLQRVAFIKGHINRCNADGKDYYNDAHDLLKSTLWNLDFTFDQRSHWERSYLLPETILPFFYGELTSLYIQYFKNDVNELIEHLTIRSSQQLGLYTEGYRAILINVIEKLAIENELKSQTEQLLQLAEKHIDEGVLNTWQRTSEFLELAKWYITLGNKRKYKILFNKSLDASNGPTWYKESQFSLIDNAMSLTSDVDIDQVIRFATILDEAAGELTFQRYVRYEKGVFVGSLATVCNLNLAVEYFKFETLPASNDIIANAEAFKIDMPRPGDGYENGTHHIIEAWAVSQLLLKKQKPSVEIALALANTFSVNDDTERYEHEYSQIYAGILNRIDIEMDNIFRNIAETIIKHLVKHIDVPSLIQRFIEDIIGNLDGQRASQFQIIASKNSIDIPKSVKKAIKVFEPAEDINKILDNKVTHIVKNAYCMWDELSHLLNAIGKNNKHGRVIQKHIEDHCFILTKHQPEKEAKYVWMKNIDSTVSDDEIIINLLIWLLDHPSKQIRGQAEEQLRWLLKYNSQVTLLCLIKYSSLYSYEKSLNTTSEMIKDYVNDNPQDFGVFLNNHPIMLDQMVNVKHFMVFYNFYSASVELKKIGHNELYNRMYVRIPPDIILHDVYLEEQHIMPVLACINELAEKGYLDGKFCSDFLQEIDAACKPLSRSDKVRADQYIQRSFRCDYGHYQGRYEAILVSAINHQLIRRMTHNNMNDIYNILSSYV